MVYENTSKKAAFKFIILLGVVSLLADMTYEGARSITGPYLALLGASAALMITERIGKAIRNPSRDAMLSHATKEIGRGWGFGLHEAMDPIGAMLGPLIVAAVLFIKDGYKTSFAILLIPALLALIVFSVITQLASIPFLIMTKRAMKIKGAELF